MEASNNNPWFLTILRMIKHSLHALLSFVIKCLKGIGCFLKKRWRILVGVIAGIAIIIGVGALCNYIIEVVLPQMRENKAVDIVENKLHSDNPNERKECAYHMLNKAKHSDNFKEFIYYNDLTFKEVKDRFDSLTKEAFELIKKEAFAGDAECQFYLGNLYFYKESLIENDFTKAAYWWNEAALQGFVRAYNNIGICYRDGTGVNKDMKLAVEWLKKGAEAGESYAQYNYGSLFLEGVKIQIGTHRELKPGYSYIMDEVPDYEVLLEKDIDQAKYWWGKAAEQGHSGAIDALQKIYN